MSFFEFGSGVVGRVFIIEATTQKENSKTGRGTFWCIARLNALEIGYTKLIVYTKTAERWRVAHSGCLDRA
jgi:hypothetical protein